MRKLCGWPSGPPLSLLRSWGIRPRTRSQRTIPHPSQLLFDILYFPSRITLFFYSVGCFSSIYSLRHAIKTIIANYLSL